MILTLCFTTRFQVTAQEVSIELMNTLGRGTIVQAVLSADGERIVMAGSRGMWVYDNQFNDVAHIDAGAVQEIAWSSDDHYLVVLTNDRQLSVWDMTEYQRFTEVEFPNNEPFILGLGPIAWKPDSHLLTITYVDDIRLWNADTGNFEAWFTIPTRRYKTDIEWSPDGTQLAVAAFGEVKVWDMLSDQPLLALDLRDSEYSGGHSVNLAWSPEGTRLAIVKGWAYEPSLLRNNTLSVIDPRTGNTELVLQAGLTADVDWSPDGRMLATATADFGVRRRTPINVWDAQTGELLAELISHTREAHTVQWHPDGQHLLSAAYDNTAYLWDVQPELPTNQMRDRLVLRGHMDQVNVLAWSPDSTQLATGTEDGSIRVWDVATGEMLETDFQADLFGIQALDYSPDGRYLAAGGGENWVRIWGLTNDVRIYSASYQHGPSLSPGEGNIGGINTVGWSPDSSMLASAADDGMVKLWKLDGAASDVSTLRQDGGSVLSLYWSVDNARLFMDKYSPEIWDITTGKELPTLCGKSNFLLLDVSRDEQYLAVSDHHGPYFLCDIYTGELLSLAAPILDWTPVYPVAVGPDRHESTSNSQRLILFNPLTFNSITSKRVAEFTVDGHIQTAVWSPDGRSLAIGLEDGTVQLWRFTPS